MTLTDRGRAVLWVAWLVTALLLLDVLNLTLYGVLVPLSALALASIPGTLVADPAAVDGRDLRVVALVYAVVVAFMYAAFQVFTVDRTLGLFLCFAAALLTGTIGPIYFSCWLRDRSLADLGLRLDNWRPAVGLGLLLAAIQFALTLSGTTLPADPVDWVPLAVMALMVGLFEAIFFRGFVQTRLTASLGVVPGTAAAAALYALYHVGYGMGWAEMVFLFGLGVVYAVAYACVRNVLVLWPLLIPMGSFFNNLQSGGFDLPWASILGFLDVIAAMLAAIFVAHRHERRRVTPGDRTPVPAT